MESGKEQGSAFAVYHEGELIIDMWAGYADREAHRRWRNQTSTLTFDCSKGALAILMALLVNKGHINYSRPIADHWPQFGKHGKDTIALETLLSHQAGLPYLTESLSLRDLKSDLAGIESRLFEQKIVRNPESQAEYHEITLGLYADRIIPRIDPHGRQPEDIFHEEISKPFAIQYDMNLRQRKFCHTARLHKPSVIRTILQALMSPKYLHNTVASLLTGSYVHKAVSFLKEYTLPVSVFNNPELREINLSSFTGTGTARGLAKLYSLLANGGILDGNRLLFEAVLDQLTTPVADAVCPVTGDKTKYTMGLQVFENPLGEKTYGHAGYGGQMAFADPTQGLSMAYLTNYLSIYRHGDDPRFVELKNAVYRNLDKYITRKKNLQGMNR